MQRVILAAIARPEALATREDGRGPVGVPITEIYQELYGTEEPSAAQRQSVQHAVTRLGDQIMRSRRPGPRIEVTRAVSTHVDRLAPCHGAKCLSCGRGNRARPLDPWPDYGTRANMIRLYGKDSREMELAEQHGCHEWTDYTSGRSYQKTYSRYTSLVILSRPATEAEKAARSARYAQLVSAARNASGR